MRILQVTAELQPLVKTGGLADVLGSLPAAQRQLGHEVTVLMPGYASVLEAAGRLRPLPAAVLSRLGVRLLRGKLAGDVELLLIDQPDLYAREGGPYEDALGREWPDNDQRFAVLGRTAAALCREFGEIDVLHAHDWHAGLAPAYLRAWGIDCASIFTIHNLAYQGRFEHARYADTGLPEEFYRFDGLEYHDDWSFMKAALSYSDLITTVSPTYAREILRPEVGMGLHDLLNYRRRDLFGILNGVDYATWNPEIDPALPRNYSSSSLRGKQFNKKELQQALHLDQDPGMPLIGIVSRLTVHKGLDFAVDALAPLLAAGELQLALLGSGDPLLESEYERLARQYPQRCSVTIGYDEARAHRIFGGADAILIPSRFEPCGLTQMYGLRYGTLPIVRNTGGLADTVTGYGSGKRADATGFVFNAASILALKRTLKQVAKCYRQASLWRSLMQNAMSCEFGWDRAARSYIELYSRMTKA